MKPVIIIAISVLIVGVSVTSISAQSSMDIPSWVKTNAVWWGEGQISDSEFLSALQYLINNELLKVGNSDTDVLEDKIKNLETENIKLTTENRVLGIDNARLKGIIDLKNSRENYVEEEIDTSQLTIQELKEQSVTWDYKDILRNEEHYKGKIIYLAGSIDTVIEREDYGDWVLLEVQTEEYGAWDTIFYVWHDGSRVLRNDTIGAYVVVDGIEKRETLMAGSYILNPIGTSMYLTCTSC